MQASTLYQSIYTYFGDTTPLLADCGALCGKACCGGDSGNSDGGFNNADSLCDSSEETGMYLFPGEKPLFLNLPGFQVVPSEFVYGGRRADLLLCSGLCRRSARPLSCRIFPLIPYFRENAGLRIIIDPRAYSLCPLTEKEAYPFLNPSFQRKTESVFRLLLKFSEMRAFLEGLTDILDDYLKFEPKGAIRI